jgi:hypothetical protein
MSTRHLLQKTHLAVTSAGKLSYYLIDTIDVKPDQMQKFIELMYQLIDGAFREQGWTLVSATYTVTGRPTTVVHLWSIPSANSVLQTMIKLADNPTYVELMACVDSEVQQILTPMIYNPSGPSAPDKDDH